MIAPRCTKWHGLLLLVLIVVVSGLVVKEHRLENVKIDASTMVGDNCKELIPTTIIYLDELETGNFTSTGFTYNSANQTFWIADHGTDNDGAFHNAMIPRTYISVYEY